MFQNYELNSTDETLERLVAMTAQTNLVALDKSLAAIRRAPENGYAASAERVGSIGERIVHAAHEVGMTLPYDMRAISACCSVEYSEENNDNVVNLFKQ